MIEIWKALDWFGGYYLVSNLGRIKALPRKKIMWNGVALSKEKILKPHSNIKNGYYSILVCVNKTKKRFYVHRIVAEAFIPNVENKKDVNHLDGNKANNSVSNLEWATRSENKLHAFATGITETTKGSKQGGSKLSELDVMEIRDLWETGNASRRRISEKYGVAVPTITNILNGKTWRHLPHIKRRVNEIIILDTNTGIFYTKYTEAAAAKGLKIKSIHNKLNGHRPNDTGLILA